MPDQGVSNNEIFVFDSQLNKCIRVLERIMILLRVYERAFHAVFRDNGIEMFLEQLIFYRIRTGDLATADCRAHIKLSIEQIFYAFFCFGGYTYRSCQEYTQNDAMRFHHANAST